MPSFCSTAHLHLEWIKKHPSFIPESRTSGFESKTYLEEMMSHYLCWHNPEFFPQSSLQMMCDSFFSADLRLFESYEERLSTKKIEYNISNKKFSYFCTVGFNHQTWTIEKCVNVINTILSFPWVMSCRAVFEYHRENGLHPHCHFLITTDIVKSKVVEKLWAAKGIKAVVLKKSFIDVKPAIDNHKKYILLDKQPTKMSYVVEDRIWRKANNIPEFFEK